MAIGAAIAEDDDDDEHVTVVQAAPATTTYAPAQAYAPGYAPGYAGPAPGAVAIGTVAMQLPSGCSSVAVNGFTYQHCGSVWYQPNYVGNELQYVVVNAPM
jgi:hypothetical protein